MNQPQLLSISCNFQGFLVCQIPKEVIEVELKIKTKWGKFTLHTDQHTGTEKYRPGRRSAATESIPEGDYSAVREQANPTWTVQQTQVPLLIVAKGWGILLKPL